MNRPVLQKCITIIILFTVCNWVSAKKVNFIEGISLSTLKQSDITRLSSEVIQEMVGAKLSKFPELKLAFLSEINFTQLNLNGKKVNFTLYFEKNGKKYLVDRWPDIYLEYFVTKTGKILSPSDYSFSNDFFKLKSIGYSVYFHRKSSSNDKTTKFGQYVREPYNLCKIDEKLVLRLESVDGYSAKRSKMLFERSIPSEKIHSVLDCKNQ